MLSRLLQKRAVVLILGLCAIGALIILSAGLTTLEFMTPREALLWDSPDQPLQTNPGAAPLFDTEWLLKLILFTIALFVALFIIALFDARIRKWFFQRLPYWLTILAVLYVLSRFTQSELPMPPVTAIPPTPMANTPMPTITAEYSPPQIPLALAFTVAVMILLIIAGLLYYLWQHRPMRGAGAPVMAELGSIVQNALDDLDAGRNWEDTIIQCYVRMSKTVSAERGLHRQQATTPAEFAERLVRAGLPTSAVQRLTHLFEAVRYGAQPSTRAEVDEAVACLRAIVAACGEVA